MDGLSQFKLGVLEGIEALALDRPTDWRASGIVRPDGEFPTLEELEKFNAGVEFGFRLYYGTRTGA